MKRVLKYLFLCSSFPLMAFGGLRVEDDADAWLGEFPAGESRGAVFTLRNGGAETERVRALSRSCDCPDVSASTNAVAPGASATVTVRVRPRQEPGPFSVSVYVVTFSRDPASRVVKLTVSGRAVLAKPESACAGRGKVAESFPSNETGTDRLQDSGTAVSTTATAGSSGRTSCGSAGCGNGVFGVKKKATITGLQD
ncbi:MAG: DUF1573 domain-containing protein [Kiritimatiellae bacterium]|nr:DUF1573 domain-containing protein [Kiritimatiellia bacterium]